MFTRAKFADDIDPKVEDYSGEMLRRINGILNMIARYSAVARLNPGDTCEIPKDVDNIGGACLVLDSYEPQSVELNEAGFGLMLIMEVHRDEMECAMRNGSAELFTRLKAQGVYPCIPIRT